MSFPTVPVDSISVRCVIAIMIQTIQIGVMTSQLAKGVYKSNVFLLHANKNYGLCLSTSLPRYEMDCHDKFSLLYDELNHDSSAN